MWVLAAFSNQKLLCSRIDNLRNNEIRREFNVWFINDRIQEKRINWENSEYKE